MFFNKKKKKERETKMKKKQQERISDVQRQKLFLFRVGKNVQMMVHFNFFMALQ